jgi:hypothetical protein
LSRTRNSRAWQRFGLDVEIEEDLLELQDIRSAIEEMQSVTETGVELHFRYFDNGVQARTSVQTDSAPVPESLPAA